MVTEYLKEGQAMDILLLIYLLTLSLSAGLYFVFSNTIMAALNDLGKESATSAMRQINRVIQNPIFLSIFAGPLLLGSILSWYHLSANKNSAGLWILASLLTYFLGVFLVTILANIPMNNRLEASDKGSYWQDYLKNWTRFNTLRYLACLLSLTLAILGILG